jgi:hypothetical protein
MPNLFFILLRMEFWGFRLAVLDVSCSCTDPDCDRHPPVRYYK